MTSTGECESRPGQESPTSIAPLALKGEAPAGRLEASGSWNAMVSHRVRLGKVDEVDAELIGWLRAAYDRA